MTTRENAEFDDENVEDEGIEGEDFEDEDFEDEELEDQQEAECPYCSSSGACEHLLLCFDTNEQSAQGGALLGDFFEKNQVWEAEFERQLSVVVCEFVSRLAQTMVSECIESGPGQSSSQDLFYCASEAAVKAAVDRFRRARIKISIEG